ncbi:hypothetical protein K438DRAFT_1746712 [Mycena galopus ATCC 62051]|nr:hypothetical protein K438DRAFT_1746712 [Mycena galopus ATCC 62051]
MFSGPGSGSRIANRDQRPPLSSLLCGVRCWSHSQLGTRRTNTALKVKVHPRFRLPVAFLVHTSSYSLLSIPATSSLLRNQLQWACLGRMQRATCVIRPALQFVYTLGTIIMIALELTTRKTESLELCEVTTSFDMRNAQTAVAVEGTHSIGWGSTAQPGPGINNIC